MIKSLKESSKASFAAVAVVYVLAAACGIAVNKMLDYEWWLNLLIADIAATVLTFVFSVIFKNASVYDPYWSVQPIVILFAFAFGHTLTLTRLLFLAVVCFWGVRLTLNWAYTFKNLYHQDWRYTMLKEQTGIFYPIVNLVGIHLVPTLIVYCCTLPAVYVFINDGNASALTLAFLLISVAAVLLQGTADYQMHRFRKNKSGNFIRNGLWRYSRHPNYLGEILMWWGIALAAVSIFPNARFLCAGALANTLLFLFVSIPMADKRQSRKEGFEEYKSETRMLFPIKK